MIDLKTKLSSLKLDNKREIHGTSSKFIVIAPEGSVTENEYISIVNKLFKEIDSKILLVSIKDKFKSDYPESIDIPKPPEKDLHITMPNQLYDALYKYKEDHQDEFFFEDQDEFWIVCDVDKNFSQEQSPMRGKTYREALDLTIKRCETSNFRYAISNPLFEMWLLLHYTDPSDKDKSFAVTPDHAYEPKVTSSYFTDRLQKDFGCRIKNKKHISLNNIDEENIRQAISRAKKLHLDENDLCPQYFSTTIYKLFEELFEIKDSMSKTQSQSGRVC